MSIRLLGWPKKEFVEHEGLWLTHRDLTGAHDVEALLEQGEVEEPSIDEDDPVLPALDRKALDEGA
ncbi:MAG: hypothetical protein ABEL51_14955 [Salinibacter sp.]